MYGLNQFLLHQCQLNIYLSCLIVDRTHASTILGAMHDISSKTCISFVERTGENDYIRIQSAETGCWSQVGYSGSRVDVNLQRPGCVTKKGTVLHEILHALGFVHEHSRYDRDDNVVILWNNIKSGEFNIENNKLILN